LATFTIHNSIRQQIHKNKNKTLFVFLYFNQTYGMQQYMIKASLGLGLMIQFKAKTPNNILVIPTLGFTPYVTSPNILATSLNFNNNTNVSNLSLRVRINNQNSDVMNDKWCTLCLDAQSISYLL